LSHFSQASEVPIDVLYEDDDLIALVKPTGLPTHAPHPRRLGFVEVLQQRLGHTLGVHQRLDAGTSGVILFSKNAPGALHLAGLFERREIHKRYRALSIGALAETSGSLDTPLAPDKSGRMRPNPQGQEARTDYRLVRRAGPFHLYELSPHTGRTHQLRAHLAGQGCPILGDDHYGGGHGTGRLLLHAASLTFTDRQGQLRQLEAPPPPLLTEAGLTLDALLAEILATWPQAVHPEAALRLADAASSGVPELGVDLLAGYAVLRHYLNPGGEPSRWDPSSLNTFVEALAAARQTKGIYCKAFVPHAGPTPASVLAAGVVHGEAAPEALPVREGAWRFLVALNDGVATGLYLDQAENRHWVQEHAHGEVLNLFAYTCTFSVAAATGDATRVTSVDLSRRALKWGRDNFLANGLDPGAHRFFAEDAFELLARCHRRQERFGSIICDPPSFARHKRKTFDLERDLPRLMEACLGALAPGGALLFSINHRQIRKARLLALAERQLAATGRRSADLEVEVTTPAHGPLGVGTDLKTLRLILA